MKRSAINRKRAHALAGWLSLGLGKTLSFGGLNEL